MDYYRYTGSLITIVNLMDSDLLREIQLSQVYGDPQYFLRLKLLKPQRDILYEFRELDISNTPLSERNEVLKKFVERNFQNASGVEKWVPTDFRKNPKILKKIKDKKLRKKLQHFNKGWLMYGRKLTKDVVSNPESYSFIPVPKPFFVSSENEYEMGYWESFWIFQGLMACDMIGSAKGLMENIFAIVDKLGYCPPYNRVYFRGRTSPPVLPLMMSIYLERTNDTDFLADHLIQMDSDLTTWLRHRLTVLESPFHAFLIVAEDWWPQVRAERLREDVMSIIRHTKTEQIGPREMLWETDPSILSTSVLLTALTEVSARLLAAWLRQFGHKAKARVFLKASQEMNYTLHNLLRFGDCWSDLHLDHGYRQITMSSLSPIWLGAANLPCETAKLAPVSTGPEAVISSRCQALRWMSDISRVNVDSLVDIAAAFKIADTAADMVLDQPPEVKPTRIKPFSLFLLTLLLVVCRFCLIYFFYLFKETMLPNGSQRRKNK